MPDQIINDEQCYVEAIDLILSKAQHQLLIFDQDFKRGNFSSLTKYQLLKNFLAHNIASELIIILQNAEYFQLKCPRLNALFKVYQHKMFVYVTNNKLKNIKECFIVADGEHYIKRIHIDQARFRYAIHDKLNSEILHNRFLTLQADAQDAVSMTNLGL
jgi:hypothetical protein